MKSPPRPGLRGQRAEEPSSANPASTNPTEPGGPPWPTEDETLVGKTIDGRYSLDAILGEGGMGIVYQGRHLVIGKRVAIKVLRREFTREKQALERFLQEARAASSIGNPHIVDISDYGVLPDGANYIVMELLDGRALSDAIYESGTLPLKKLLSIARQIARGLGAAHAQGIVHRDLKPDNVHLVPRGADGQEFVKILDFGIAKVGAATGAMPTLAGAVFGTPHYMSPEQANGNVVDLRSDVYALGIILYEMAYGKPPFDAENYMGILSQHVYKAPVPLSLLVPDIPVELNGLVLRCLAKDPKQRPASMQVVVDEISELELQLFGAVVDPTTGELRIPASAESSSRLGAAPSRGSGTFDVRVGGPPSDPRVRVATNPNLGLASTTPPTPGASFETPRRRRLVFVGMGAAGLGVIAMVGAIVLVQTRKNPRDEAARTAPSADSVVPRAADSTEHLARELPSAAPVASTPAAPSAASSVAAIASAKVVTAPLKAKAAPSAGFRIHDPFVDPFKAKKK